MPRVRPELPSDVPAIHAVLAAAFPTADEAKLVDALRAAGRLTVSLVAEENGRVVGHVALSPVTVEGTPGGLGLAPVAVHPDCQRAGIGSRLVRDSLVNAVLAGAGFVVVLGHTQFYPRFGFRRAADFGLGNEYGVDAEFMAVELVPGGLPTGGGLVKYCAEFAAFG